MGRRKGDWLKRMEAIEQALEGSGVLVIDASADRIDQEIQALKDAGKTPAEIYDLALAGGLFDVDEVMAEQEAAMVDRGLNPTDEGDWTTFYLDGIRERNQVAQKRKKLGIVKF